jgi:hypothetical protein
MSSILKVNTIQDGGGNAIITSDGSGNLTTQNILTPSFLVRRNASVSAQTDNTYFKIQFDAEDYDTDSIFDSSTNYRATIPSGKAGKYFIYATCQCHKGSDDNSGLNRGYLAIYKNGSINTESLTSLEANPGKRFQMHVHAALDLSASDYIEIYAASDVDSGNANIRISNNNTFFGMFRLGS